MSVRLSSDRVEHPDLGETDDDVLRKTWTHRPGFLNWFRAVDHKIIGKRQVVTAFVFFLIGGILALGLAFWMSMTAWRAAGAGWPGEAANVRERDRFLGLLGMIFSAYLSLMAFALWFPVFLVNPCQR